MTTDRKVTIRTVTVIRDKVPTPSGTDGFVLTEREGLMAWEELPKELPALSGDDGKVLTERAGAVHWETPTDLDDKVRATAADTTPGYLQGKLKEGTNITLTVEDPGENEKLRIDATGGSATDELVKTSPSDSTAMYLSSKLSPGDNVEIEELFDEGVGYMRISAVVDPMVDEKAKVSSTDANADFLQNKIQPGSGVSIDVVGGPGEEQNLSISAPGVPVQQSALILAVDILGSDVPSPDRPSILYGGDYSAFPFLTIQGAIDSVVKTRGPATTINVGPGTWDPIRVAGISSDREFTIQGTPGTPIGPFEITGVVEDGWEYSTSGATWTPGAYSGLVYEVLSGPGAGSFGSIFDNGADSIKTCAHVGDDSFAIGSVFQIIPFSTTILGPSDPFSLTLSMTALMGRFVLKDLAITGSPGQYLNIQGSESEGARITLYRCLIGGSAEMGFSFEGIGTLVLAAVLFRANNMGGTISNVGSLQVNQSYMDENWLTPMGWYSVGGIFNLYVENSGLIQIDGCRFNGLGVDKTRNVELREIMIEPSSSLYSDGCDQVSLFDIFGSRSGGSIGITRARILSAQGTSESPVMDISAVQIGLVHFGSARVHNLSFVQCRDINLSNVYFPLVGGMIAVDCGYLRERILYNISGQVFDGASFYPFSDFNPGPTSKYVTSKSLTITLESEALP